MLTKGQYNKTLRICNLQEIDKFRRKLESSSIVSHKHTSLPRNLYFTSP